MCVKLRAGLSLLALLALERYELDEESALIKEAAGADDPADLTDDGGFDDDEIERSFQHGDAAGRRATAAAARAARAWAADLADEEDEAMITI